MIEQIKAYDEFGEHVCFFDPPVPKFEAFAWVKRRRASLILDRDWSIRFLTGDPKATNDGR